MADLEALESDGFAITQPLLSAGEIGHLLLIEQAVDPDPRRGGVRDVMDSVPALRAVAEYPAIRGIVGKVLGPEAFVVRATLFDKTGSANWKVPWHQDVTVAVRDRKDVDGYSPWSIKNGVLHVQSPSHVLERMVTVRVHLDDCPASNGPLRVMRGTHRLGRLNQNNVDGFIDESTAVCCEVAAGAALIMRPLLLHASSASATPSHRRVLHFDFAAGELDGGLRWRMRGGADAAHCA